MPPVNRQSPTSAKPKVSSVLDRIAPVQVQEDGIKLLVYGRGKTGKTRLACTFPKPALLIGTEDGTKSVSTVQGVDFVRIYASDELPPLVDLLQKGKYKSVAFDTAGGLQDLILKEVLGLVNVPVQKSWGLTDRSTWGVVGQQFKERMASLLSLADTFGINVVIIAHERSFGDEGNSDAIAPTVGAALTPSAAGWLNAACDYICQTYIREQTITKTAKVGTKTVTTSSKTGKMEYCLRVGPHPVVMTGFRMPEGGAELPDSITPPHYDRILSLIKGE